MEFAAVPNYPLSGLIYGMHNQGTRKLPYCYVVIKGQGQLAMVDVGYNHKALRRGAGQHVRRARLASAARSAGRNRHRSPRTSPTSSSRTAHFDHMGNIEDFPNATFYMQERELSKWVWTMSLERRFRWLMLGIDPADIMRAVDLARQGRLVCVDGDRENVLPGVDLHAAFDTHTWGSHVRDGPQRSRAEFPRQLGSSAATWPIRTKTCAATIPTIPSTFPIGLATGSQFNVIMTAEKMVKSVGGDVNRVIPPHEERLKDLYPSRITRTDCASPNWLWPTARKAKFTDSRSPFPCSIAPLRPTRLAPAWNTSERRYRPWAPS